MSSRLVIILTLLLAVLVCAQSKLEIESGNNSVVHPGDTLVVTARTPNNYANLILGGGSLNILQVLTVPPYRFSIQIPKDTVAGRYGLTAAGCRRPGDCDAFEPLPIDVDLVWSESSNGSRAIHDAPGVTVDMGGNPLMHRPPISYPHEAIAAGIGGTAVVELTPQWDGHVFGVQYLSGPEELRKHVIKAVLLWHFPVQAGNLPRQVKILFDSVEARHAEGLPVAIELAPVGVPNTRQEFFNTAHEQPPPVLKSVDMIAVSDDVREELLKRFQVSVGQPMESKDIIRISIQTAILDKDLIVWMSRQGAEVSFTITPRLQNPEPPPEPVNPRTAARPGTGITPQRIKVSAADQEAKLITRVEPEYSPTAKLNHLQGVVRLWVLVDREGRVARVSLVHGNVFLGQAAEDAVKQWVYSPTLVNGSPVEVATEVEVEFFPPN